MQSDSDPGRDDRNVAEAQASRNCPGVTNAIVPTGPVGDALVAETRGREQACRIDGLQMQTAAGRPLSEASEAVRRGVEAWVERTPFD